MIGQVCAHVNNYFEVDAITGERRIYTGRYTIEDGSINLPFLQAGSYFRIINSRHNDGVHQYPAMDLKDETFDGVIWEMRPPQDFLGLVQEIEDWVEKYGQTMSNPYASESVIGVYSYTKGGGGVSWDGIFKKQLNAYRRLY